MASDAAAGQTWNKNNRAVRRILADVRELAREPSDQYAAKPLEDDMFDWHFVIRGPRGTDFEGGVYHGRIILPGEYPFKPPSIMLLTPNGRWEVNKKICLSISAYHPEQWQPAWGIRTILEALISFMETPGDGAVGALDFSPEERRRLAKESLNYEHPLMPQLPELNADVAASEQARNRYREEISKMHIVSLEERDTKDDNPAFHEQSGASASIASLEPSSNPSGTEEAEKLPPAAPNAGIQPGRGRGQITNDRTRHNNTQSRQHQRDWLLYYAFFLALTIFAILYRKALRKFREEL